MFRRLTARLTEHPDRGATAVEYALMVMLIALVIVGAVTAIGTSLNTIFTNATGMFG